VEEEMTDNRISKTAFAGIYPMYVKKLERKSIEMAKDKVDACIFWLTGYNQEQLQHALDTNEDFKSFFEHAPHFNKHAKNIKGVICGHRVEEIIDPLMQKIRYLDKLVDELARGRRRGRLKFFPDHVTNQLQLKGFQFNKLEGLNIITVISPRFYLQRSSSGQPIDLDCTPPQLGLGRLCRSSS
jgi:hypothetical protein